MAVMRLAFLPLALLATTLVAASQAQAHCCHDERSLGVAEREGLRRGLHSGAGGLGDDDREQAQPPSIGPGLGRGAAGAGTGNFGQMQGNSLGNYGAGRVGEAGPGGVGNSRGNWVGGEPPRGQ